MFFCENSTPSCFLNSAPFSTACAGQPLTRSSLWANPLSFHEQCSPRDGLGHWRGLPASSTCLSREQSPVMPSGLCTSLRCLCKLTASMGQHLGLAHLAICREKLLCVCCWWGCSLAVPQEWRFSQFACSASGGHEQQAAYCCDGLQSSIATQGVRAPEVPESFQPARLSVPGRFFPSVKPLSL